MTSMNHYERQTLALLLEFRHGVNFSTLLKKTAASYILITVFVMTMVGGCALFGLWQLFTIVVCLSLGAVIREIIYIRRYAQTWSFQSQFFDWSKIEATVAALEHAPLASRSTEQNTPTY